MVLYYEGSKDGMTRDGGVKSTIFLKDIDDTGEPKLGSFKIDVYDTAIIAQFRMVQKGLVDVDMEVEKARIFGVKQMEVE